MPFIVSVEEAIKLFPQYRFVKALTPSEQKAAFLVQDKNGESLCLKIISPEYELDRLKRELIALQRLNHPNIVRLKEYTYSSRPGNVLHYMVEEFIDGDDLTDLLGPEKKWSPEKSASFFLDFFEGLSELKKVNIVHRDLKPSNIRVRKDGKPAIIDFGLARHLDLSDLTRTEDGAAIGTPKYFAPEQFNGTKHDIDHRTDLYAAGLLMFETLVGLHPYWTPGISIEELRQHAIVSTDFLQHPDLQKQPANIKMLVKRLLEKERVNRPHEARVALTILSKGR